MGIHVGFLYCTGLTKDEVAEIDKQVKKNRKELKMAIVLTIFGWSFLPVFPSIASEIDKSEQNLEQIRDHIETNETQSNTEIKAKSQIVIITGSGDKFDKRGKRLANDTKVVLNINRGGDGKSAPSSSSSRTGSSVIPGVGAFQNRFPGAKNPSTGRSPARMSGKNIFPGPKQGPSSGKSAGSKGQSYPGKTPPAKKLDRLPSGFGGQYKKKGRGLSGGPSGSGSGSNGSGNSAEYDSSSQKPKKPLSKSQDQCSNPNYFTKQNPRKKKKAAKNRKRTLKRQEVYDRYKEFVKEMKQDGYDIFDLDCDYQRFEDMCRDPRTGLFTAKEMFQAEGGLALEAQGVIKNVRLNTDLNVNIDLVAELTSTGETILLDAKRAKNFDGFRDNYGNLVAETSKRANPLDRAFDSGQKAVDQQNKWRKAANGRPIYEFYDLKEFRNTPMIPGLIEEFTNGVESMGGDMSTILFTRYL